MSIGTLLADELEREAAATRRVLERAPFEEPDWKPHPKSMTVAALAGHVATVPDWTVMMLEADSFDAAPPGGEPMKPSPEPKSAAEAVATFNAGLAAAVEALRAADDERMQGDWEMLKGGARILKAPRAGLIRQWVLNHLIHHRAQLGVYLRLRDIPVPPIYGPTADEGGF